MTSDYVIDEVKNEFSDYSAENESASRAVEIYCRLRPSVETENNPLSEEMNSYVEYLDTNTVRIQSNRQQLNERNVSKKECKFSRVFSVDEGQEVIFNEIARPMVVDLFENRDNLLFTYGVTGSGKTYTITGDSGNPGIIPRVLVALYKSINDRVMARRNIYLSGERLLLIEDPSDYTGSTNSYIVAPDLTLKQKEMMELAISDAATDTINQKMFEGNKKFAVFLSFIEIYNNKIFDLLSKIEPHQRIIKTIDDTFLTATSLDGCQYYCSDLSQAISAYANGRRNRHVSSTELNERSSRGHCIFTIKLVTFDYSHSDKPEVSLAQNSICDLAGSERTKRTKNEGDRLRESNFINTSLSALQNCIVALKNKQRFESNSLSNSPHALRNKQRFESNSLSNSPQVNISRIIPYRDNLLTVFFRSYFEGLGKIRMVVCLSVDSADVDENMHVTRFADATRDIQVNISAKNPTPLSVHTPSKQPCLKKVATPRKLTFHDHVQDNEGKTKRLSTATPPNATGKVKNKKKVKNANSNSFSNACLIDKVDCDEDQFATEYEKKHKKKLVQLLTLLSGLSSDELQKRVDSLQTSRLLVNISRLSLVSETAAIDRRLEEIFRTDNLIERIPMVLSNFDLQTIMRKCESTVYSHDFLLRNLVMDIYNEELADSNQANSDQLFNSKDVQAKHTYTSAQVQRKFDDNWKNKLRTTHYQNMPYEKKILTKTSGLTYPACPNHILKSPADADILPNLREYVINNVYFFEEIYTNSKENLEQLQFKFRSEMANYKSLEMLKSETAEQIEHLTSELRTYKMKYQDTRGKLTTMETENSSNLTTLNSLKQDYHQMVDNNRALTQALNHAEATFKEKYEQKYQSEYQALTDNMVKNFNKIQRIKDIAKNDAYRNPYAK